MNTFTVSCRHVHTIFIILHNIRRIFVKNLHTLIALPIKGSKQSNRFCTLHLSAPFSYTLPPPSLPRYLPYLMKPPDRLIDWTRPSSERRSLCQIHEAEKKISGKWGRGIRVQTLLEDSISVNLNQGNHEIHEYCRQFTYRNQFCSNRLQDSGQINLF